MDRDERYLIRIMFKNRIFYSDAQAFEDLFTKIMRYGYPEFRAVKPQGAFGDKKNDGYIIDTGVFYQVYGPEDIAKSIDKAISKLKEDFKGLVEKWSDKVTIKEFCYVVNDKYKGAQVTVHEKLLELNKVLDELQGEYAITTDLMVANRLEDMLFELTEDQIIDVIGSLPPRTTALYDVDYNALNEVIEHIMSIPAKNYLDDFYVPNFEGKIKFNGLSTLIKNRLESASINYGDVETYFEYNGEFLRNDLRNRFKGLYEESKIQIDDEQPQCSDRRYIYILEKSMPKQATAYIQQAVECLMAYYFESCDIFEAPPKEEV